MYLVNNDNTSRLNSLYGEFLNCTHAPTIISGMANSVTFARSAQDAFSLVTPVARIVHVQRPMTETDADQVVVRCYIPHSEHLFDFNYGIYDIAQYKNEMLLTLAQHLDLPNRTHRFARPGREREFFMSVDASLWGDGSITSPTNYELRLYGSKL